MNPVPRGLSTRRRGGRRQQVPLVHVPRTLPKVLTPEEVRALLYSLRTDRDRAIVHGMVLAGLRRCEVLGLRLADVRVADRCLFIVDGKGGHQRVVPMSNTLFSSVGHYLRDERPATATDRAFVTMKGSRRGEPMTASGADKILQAARQRAGMRHVTCHELRHTCLTRLREAGMALEAVQAQAGHRSIESTRIYLHLTDAWLADEYRRAAALIDADRAQLASQRARR
jgi:integrase/recombinase XerD